MAVKSSSKIKMLWRKTGRGLSLKQFARDMVAVGEDETAKNWFENKAAATQKTAKAERLKNKGAKLKEIALASKNARKK